MSDEENDKISEINSRFDLIQTIDNLINETAMSLKENQRFPEYISKVKTYQIESNSPIDQIEFSDLVEVKQLDEKNLFRITVSNQYKKKPINLFADTRDSRYWSIYSFNKSQESDSRINHVVNYSFNKLDFLWFTNEFLTNIWKIGDLREISTSFQNEIYEGLIDIQKKNYSMRVWGASGAEIFEILRNDPKFNHSSSLTGLEVRFNRDIERDGEEKWFYVDERVNYDGKISVKGTSAELHFEFLKQIKNAYQTLIDRIEENQLKIQSQDGKISLLGKSFEYKFSKKIKDYPLFISNLLNGKNSLKISGIPNKMSSKHYIIPAIDLHNGDRLDLEITDNKIMVNLWDGACGNTILRLLTNLQQVFDSSSSLPLLENIPSLAI